LPEFLEKIVSATESDLAARKSRLPLEELKQDIEPRKRGTFTRALSSPGISVIAEIKRASPSKGDIRPSLNVPALAAEYESSGAAAISVLTEERFFKGSLDDLSEARRAVDLPLLRKDFVIDPYQVWEAAGAGADAILLITAALSDGQLTSLMTEADEAGLDCLVEVHDKEELSRALAAGPRAIGINNRDLRTFQVSLKTTESLAGLIPGDMIVVGESGIKSVEDVRRLARAGVDAVLVGEVLMRSASPGRRIQELLSY
jgi:indole-3-glycerol phosphate synthase